MTLSPRACPGWSKPARCGRQSHACLWRLEWKAGGRERVERRRPRAQSDPKAAGAGKESSCLAGVALELTPTQKPGRGPGPRRHTEPLASRPGEKRGFFCVWRRFQTPSLGPDPECPSRAPPRAAAWPLPASLPQAQLPREKRCLRVRRSAEWPQLVPKCRGHAQYGITVLLFLRLTWPPRRYARRWPLL